MSKKKKFAHAYELNTNVYRIRRDAVTSRRCKQKQICIRIDRVAFLLLTTCMYTGYDGRVWIYSYDDVTH